MTSPPAVRCICSSRYLGLGVEENVLEANMRFWAGSGEPYPRPDSNSTAIALIQMVGMRRAISRGIMKLVGQRDETCTAYICRSQGGRENAKKIVTMVRASRDVTVAFMAKQHVLVTVVLAWSLSLQN